MGLNWNEIKSRALLFSKTWGDTERVAFLFGLNQRITSLLLAPIVKKKRKSKPTESSK